MEKGNKRQKIKDHHLNNNAAKNDNETVYDRLTGMSSEYVSSVIACSNKYYCKTSITLIVRSEHNHSFSSHI